MDFDRASLLLAFALTAIAVPVHADELTAAQRETARSLMHRGDQKMAGGDLTAALEAFEAADAIMHVPTTALAVGKARARLGFLVEATDALGRVRRHPKVDPEPAVFTAAREEAALLDADLARRIPVVIATIRGPAAETPITLTVDGVDHGAVIAGQPLRLNPGRHELAFDAPGYHPEARSVELVEEQEEAIELTLRPDPKEQARIEAEAEGPETEAPAVAAVEAAPVVEERGGPWTTVAITSFAIGGAGLVAGAITGGLAFAERDALEERCGGLACPPSEQGAHDRMLTLANASNATLVIGGLGVAAGVTALVLDLAGEEAGDQARITPLVGPTEVGVRIRF